MKTITFDDTKFQLVPIDSAEQPVAGQEQPDADPVTKSQYRSMFNAACAELGAINEKLGLDPDDGGAEPILEAIDELHAKIGGEPNMFWDADNPEINQDSIHNVLVEVQCDRSLKVGDIVEIQRAISLPNQSVRITAVDDEDGNGDLEYEVLGTHNSIEQQSLLTD